MLNIPKRLIISLILNIIMIIFAISTIIIEIVNIHNSPDSVYQNVWGLFRYFTIDGNLLCLIFTTIITINQIKAIRLPEGESFKNLIFSHFLYLISLMSCCTELVIFVVVVFIFIPMADNEWRNALVGSFNASSFHITIPILINIRFIFLDVRERDLKFKEKFIGGLPMCSYGIIMYILCGSKIFKTFDKDKNGGDGKIPYPFLDIYHQNLFFCIFSAIFIFAFGFSIGFLLDYLNKIFKDFFSPYEKLESDNEEEKNTKILNQA